MQIFCCLCSLPWLSTNFNTCASCSAFSVLISTGWCWFFFLISSVKVSHSDSWSWPYAGRRRPTYSQDQESEWRVLFLFVFLMMLTTQPAWSHLPHNDHSAPWPPLHHKHPPPSSLPCAWQPAWSILPDAGKGRRPKKKQDFLGIFPKVGERGGMSSQFPKLFYIYSFIFCMPKHGSFGGVPYSQK